MKKVPGDLQTISFGPFELDAGAGELHKHGLKIGIQELPLRILHMLLESPGRVVTRDELRSALWPTNSYIDFDQGLNRAITKLRDALADSAEEPRFVETLSRRGYRFIGVIEASPRRIESLAVLPLENLSRDPDQEYFAEGMTEALITSLAKIGALRVVSRTSVMQYQGVRRSLREIARELQVDGVVEGTVQRSGKRLRISAQLIHAPTDTHLWAESYDRDLRDVLALQSEVAQAIAREIQVKLTPLDQARFAQVHTVDPEAYDAYLQGRYHWNRRPAELTKAIQCFRAAIAKDSTYVAAYAGLADSLSSTHAWGLTPAIEGSVKAKGLAEKAVEMDYSSAEAHTSLAYATMYHYDFLAAEREFELAIELNPRYIPARQLFGWYLGATGRYEESYTEFRRAIRLDPLSSIINAMFGFAYLYAHRYDQAIDQFLKTLKLDPNCGPAHFGLGWAYRCKSLYEPAIPALRKAIEQFPGTTPLAVLGEVYAAADYRDEANGILEQLNQLSKQQHLTAYGVARIYVALGETDQAFHWLETAYRERDNWMLLLKVDPSLDALRCDPRFQALLRRMKFPT